MIKSITAINHLGESIKLELGDPESSGFLIQSIDGLGPCKATINTTDLSTTDGSFFNSARLSARNIVIKMAFLFKPTIEDVRQLSYKYFPIKKRIGLLIETDNRTCEIYGYVESNEPDIFSNEESTQISILCPDPYFYSPDSVTTVFSDTTALFEFEFSNESLTDSLLEMGNIVDKNTQSIIYTGDGDIGVVITMYATGPVTYITIYNSGTHETMKIDTDKLASIIGSGIIYGDEIVISTVKGNKYVMFLRNGVYTNVLNCLNRDVGWFQLSKGDNMFAFTADSGATNLMFKIENQVIYEGV